MIKSVNVIFIDVSGPVGAGKSAVLASIKELLEQHGHCVAVPERGLRHDLKEPLSSAPSHALPSRDKSVFVLTESLSSFSKIGRQETPSGTGASG